MLTNLTNNVLLNLNSKLSLRNRGRKDGEDEVLLSMISESRHFHVICFSGSDLRSPGFSLFDWLLAMSSGSPGFSPNHQRKINISLCGRT